jgi:hypothetical protein
VEVYVGLRRDLRSKIGGKFDIGGVEGRSNDDAFVVYGAGIAAESPKSG